MAENAPLVLVSGASGFVASHCIKQLLEAGEYRVRGTVRKLSDETICEALKSLCPDAKLSLELVEADLLVEESWKKAVEGCTYVLHVASPFFIHKPKHPDELMKPAVDGTLNVLKACKEVGGVKRVVVTSSVAAIYAGNLDKVLNEEHWSDPNKCGDYERSKLAAEKAAWDFVSELPEENKFELAVINPGLILGPLLLNKKCTSSDIVKQFLDRETALVPDVSSVVVDVRDVAKAHIAAMTKPEAAGKRHLLSSSDESYSFLFLANCLANEFNDKGYRVPTKKAPKPILWVLSWFVRELRDAYPFIGLKMKVDVSRMKDVLGIEPIPTAESVVEMGHTMIQLHMVKKPQEPKKKSPKKEAKKEDAEPGKSEEAVAGEEKTSDSETKDAEKEEAEKGSDEDGTASKEDGTETKEDGTEPKEDGTEPKEDGTEAKEDSK